MAGGRGLSDEGAFRPCRSNVLIYEVSGGLRTDFGDNSSLCGLGGCGPLTLRRFGGEAPTEAVVVVVVGLLSGLLREPRFEVVD